MKSKNPKDLRCANEESFPETIVQDLIDNYLGSNYKIILSALDDIPMSRSNHRCQRGSSACVSVYLQACMRYASIPSPHARPMCTELSRPQAADGRRAGLRGYGRRSTATAIQLGRLFAGERSSSPGRDGRENISARGWRLCAASGEAHVFV